jgi:predicted metal-dependent phosphoesterase TrpH
VIDLHTHTTASDGRCTPEELVARAAQARVTVLAVTDHDTVAACRPVALACAASAIAFVPGIEITAMNEGVDVHMLGYFIDVESTALQEFLEEQRRRRIDRVRRIVERLSALGLALDADAIIQPALDDPNRSAGRPWVARALVAAGHAASTDEAFERWLGRGRPAFVTRAAADPCEVVERIHDAGGLASLAHPGLVRRDEWIGPFVAGGLDAIEVYHSEHDPQATARYLAAASSLGVGTTGGSDFHGDARHGASSPGSTSLPREAFEQFAARLGRGAGLSGS